MTLRGNAITKDTFMSKEEYLEISKSTEDEIQSLISAEILPKMCERAPGIQGWYLHESLEYFAERTGYKIFVLYRYG